MSLSWGHPALLAGLALIALPIIAHLTGAGRVDRVVLPTTRLLGRAQRAIRRRRVLEDLLLLALRALAVTAVVLLFARPEIVRSVTVRAGPLPATETVIVIDRSLSTRARDGSGTVFDAIRASALEALEQIPADVPVGVVLMDGRAVPLGVGIGAERGDLASAVETLEPGFGSTDLGGALSLAADLLERAGAAPGHVLVLGDGTSTGAVPARAGGWPEGMRVTVRDLSSGDVDNAFVRSARVDEEADPAAGLPVDVEIGRTGPPREIALDVELEDMAPLRGTLAPGESAKRFTVVEPPRGLVPGVVAVRQDDLPDDDRFPFFLRTERRLKVYLLGGTGSPNERDDELYYLTTALRPEGEMSVLEPVVIGEDSLADLAAAPGTVVVLCNVPTPGRMARQLHRLVTGGAGVLIAVGDLVDRRSYAALEDLLPARLEDVKSREHTTFESSVVGLAAPDPQRAPWAPFREGGLRTFERARFDRVMEVHPDLAPGSSVLLRYTDGRAALLERRVGRGRVLLFTSTLDDDWNDLPLRGIYLPMMHQLARYLAGDGGRVGISVLRVGERAEIELPEVEGAVVVDDPGGRRQEVRVGAEGLVVVADLARPGFTTLRRRGDEGRDGEILWRLCVRTDPAESALTALDRVAIDAAIPGVVFETRGAETGEEGTRSTMLRRNALTVPLVLVLLLALGAEALGARSR